MRIEECYYLDKYREFIDFCKEQLINEVEQLAQSDYVLFQRLKNCSDSFKHELVRLARERHVDNVEIEAEIIDNTESIERRDY